MPHDVEVRFLVKNASRMVQFAVMQTVALMLKAWSWHRHVWFETAQLEAPTAVSMHAACTRSLICKTPAKSTYDHNIQHIPAEPLPKPQDPTS